MSSRWNTTKSSYFAPKAHRLDIFRIERKSSAISSRIDWISSVDESAGDVLANRESSLMAAAWPHLLSRVLAMFTCNCNGSGSS